MADIVRNVMEQTGISVTDLIAAATEIARLEYPSELVSRRDEIIKSLYVGIQCAECSNIGKEHVGDTGALVIDETQHLLIDQGKAIVSSPPEVVAEGSNDKEQPSKKRSGLKVVICLKKYKSLQVPAKATEAPQSDNCCEARTIKSSNSTAQRMHQLQNIVPEREEFTQRFENAKRKLHDNYEMAASAKKQRTVKLLSTNEVPKQGTGMLSQKGVVRTQISSTSNVGRGKVLPKRNRVSKLQMLRRTIKSRF